MSNVVYVLVREDTYGSSEIEGVFSSKERAKLAESYFEHRNGSMNDYSIREEVIDMTIPICIGNLEQELAEYDTTKDLLDRLKRSLE